MTWVNAVLQGALLGGQYALLACGLRLPIPGRVHLLLPANRRIASREFVHIERTTRPPVPIERARTAGETAAKGGRESQFLHLRESMLAKVGGVLGDAGTVIRASHEHWDGGGYPDGLLGDEIPIEARIV